MQCQNRGSLKSADLSVLLVGVRGSQGFQQTLPTAAAAHFLRALTDVRGLTDLQLQIGGENRITFSDLPPLSGKFKHL